MSKRSGFAVRITAFIEADPKDTKSMKDALDLIEMKISDMRYSDITITSFESRFMLSREVPDEPKAEVGPAKFVGMPVSAEEYNRMNNQPEMPPIPAGLKR